MTVKHIQLIAALTVTVTVSGMPVNAQRPLARMSSDLAADVYMERIVVVLPLPYMSEKRPDPPVSGYYAWRLSFGGSSESTIVLRTDSAIRASSDEEVVKASSLYLCPPEATSVLACTQKAKYSARIVTDGLFVAVLTKALRVEITEQSIVSQVRKTRPDVILRQVFEPGGRYRVDYQPISYKTKL